MLSIGPTPVPTIAPMRAAVVVGHLEPGVLERELRAMISENRPMPVDALALLRREVLRRVEVDPADPGAVLGGRSRDLPSANASQSAVGVGAGRRQRGDAR